MTYRQLTLRALAGMGIVLLAIVVSVLTLTRSERFSVWLLDAVESRAAGRISFSGVSGTFAGELRIARLDATTDAGALALEDTRLRFDLSGIIARALIVDQLSIGRASFVTSAAGPSPSGPGPGAFPALVLVREAVIESLAVTTGGDIYTLSAAQLGLRYVDGSLQITDLSTRWQDLALEAAAQIELAAGVAVDADACLRGSFGGELVSGCIRVDGVYPALTIAAELAAPFTAAADGTVTLGATPTLDVGLRWENAAVSRFADVQSPQGSARLVGPIDRIGITGAAELVYLARPLEIAVIATRQPDAIAIESLSASYGRTTLRVSGEIAADFSQAALDVSASHVDPSLFNADWPGDLEVRVDLGLFAGASARAVLDDLTVGGEVRGYPIAATGGFELSAETLTFRDVLLVSRVDRVALTGTVGPEIDLAAQAEIGDLAAWWPDARGELDADLLIRGSRTAPRVSGELGLRRAGYLENEVDRLVAAGEAGLGDGDTLDLVVGISGFRAAGVDVDEADAEIEGTIAAHSMSIRARAEQWALTARTTGGFVDGEWRGELGALAIDPTSFASWALERPSTLAVSRNTLRLDETCLAHLDARVCITLAREGAPSDALRVAATEFDLALLAPLLPDELGLGGSLDAMIELGDLSGRPGGRIVIDGRAGRVRAAATSETDVDVVLERFGVEATLANGRLALSGEFATPGFAEGKLELAVDDVAQADSPLVADIELVWLDLAALSVLSPEVDEISGTVYVDLGVTGRLDEPRVSGEARLENGTVAVPVWGVVVERINGRATATGGNRLAFTARGSIDNAELRVEGETEITADGSFPTTLRLQGEAISLVQRPEAEVFVSPDLRAEIALPNVSVSGRVGIPRAKITAVGLPAQAATPSRDTIVHGREEQAVDRPLVVAAELTVSLGDDVRYQDGKINAQVTGDLTVTYESERGAAAVGALVLTGEYDAYGNPLTLERGRLIFAGPWRNPSVDVRAVRRIDETTVGVQLTGTLEAPETRIFSEPAMSETSALSYLLFGRPLEDAGDQNTEALENAAISMGLQQALPVIERIGETLGFDEFSIRGTATDAGALMAGKYLSPNLYLRYSYGLFNRIGGLLLRYRINDRLSLETQSGEQKSMDLLYTVEKE